MEHLNVIALISGGKDSMYSVQHCLSNGHNVVALANLSPTPAPAASELEQNPDSEEERDLNSFMFQTAGHTLIPLYEQCLDIPLYRRIITGTAVQTSREYQPPDATITTDAKKGDDIPQDHLEAVEEEGDETEDILELLTSIKAAHPAANALCSGAILSTYQRTRVESVAVRLGLVPLAFLWQYPILPFSASGGDGGSSDPSEFNNADPALLLKHMADAGMDVRTVKVASGGLDESFLWQNLCDPRTIARVKRAVGRFGGSVLGEGGEFETLVVQGPRPLWKKKIVVDQDQMRIVKGEGGEAWLSFGEGRLEDLDGDGEVSLKSMVTAFPASRDGLFDRMLGRIRPTIEDLELPSKLHNVPSIPSFSTDSGREIIQFEPKTTIGPHVLSIVNLAAPNSKPLTEQATPICDNLIAILASHSLKPSFLIHAVVCLRNMSDFVPLNSVWAQLFTEPLPPSRVTIACGEKMPIDTDILVSVIASKNHEHENSSRGNDSEQKVFIPERQGLHVQSRSYWAPANIGPYSQARRLPIRIQKNIHNHGSTKEEGQDNEDDDNDNAERGHHQDGLNDAASLVYIAGQIPLTPHLMELAGDKADDESDLLGGFTERAVLALQHLWRIGTDQDVGFWSGAVAYLAPSDSFPAKARIALECWRLAHERSSQKGNDPDRDDDGREEDVDPWDQMYLRQKDAQTWTSGAEDENVPLPDWARMRTTGENGLSTEEGTNSQDVHIPPFLAVEVAELPRASNIEWQSHGFSIDARKDDRGLGYRVRVGGERHGDGEKGSDGKEEGWLEQAVELVTLSTGEVHAAVVFYELAAEPTHEAATADLTRKIKTLVDRASSLSSLSLSPCVTIYTTCTSSFAQMYTLGAHVVPCRRIWGHSGEISTAIVA